MDRFGLRDWLYRIAAELHDGPDAHLENEVRAFADEKGKPDSVAEDAPSQEPAKLNPVDTVSGPTSLTQVTEAGPETLPFTEAQIEALRKLFGSPNG